MYQKIKELPIFPLSLNFVVNLGRFFSLPFLTIYLSSQSVSTTDIGIIIGTPALVSLIVSYYSSYVIHQFSIKAILSSSMLLMATGFLGYGLTFNFILLEIFSIISGLGLAFYNPLILTVISSVNKNNSKNRQPMELNYWLTNLAGAVGPLIGAIISKLRTILPFLAYGLILIVLQVPILLNNHLYHIGFKDPKGYETVQQETKSIFRNWSFIEIVSVYLILFIMETQYPSSFGLHLEKIIPTHGVQYLAFFLTAMTMTVTLFQLIVMVLDSKLSIRFQFLLSWWLYMAGTLCFIRANAIKSLIFSAILLGMGESFLGPKIQILVGDSVSSDQKPLAFSVSTAFGNIGYFVGPVLGLKILSLGFNMYIFFLVIIVLMLGLFLGLINRRGHSK
ncbi:MFS transporter [Levilactobacillus zymae]|uniref:MFS transporter n=1 Tax=Levilactobacillus zymae TaxID=267363 RepID=UPI003FCC3011